MDGVFSESRSQLSLWSHRKDRLLEPQSEAREVARVTAKVLYDAAKASEGKTGRDRRDAMQELVVEQFDHEQIWAGLELQNSARLPEWRRDLESLLNLADQRLDLLGGDPVYRKNNTRKRKLEPEEEEEEEKEDALEELELQKRVKFDEEEIESSEEPDFDDQEEEEEGEEESDEETDKEDQDDERDSIFDDPDFQHMSDSDGDDLPLFENVHSEDEEEKSDGDEEGGAKTKTKPTTELQKKTDEYMANALKSIRGGAAEKKRSEVDDDFFKLSEMEKFLESEDMNEERRRRREEKGMDKDEDDDDEDDPDKIDYFAQDEDEEEGEGGYDESEERAMMHRDYFGGDEGVEEPMEEDEEEEDEEDEGATPQLKNLLAADDDSDSEGGDLGEVKSTFEERQLRLKKKIKALESEAVSEERPWQLRGEVTGPARPENSLLQEHLDYDTVAKAAPIITEEVSKRLEDIILQRVKDQAWDDVERKVKPATDPYEYRKRLVLDQEKSKLSLAQVYEQEYLAQKEKEEGMARKGDSLLDRDENGSDGAEVAAIRKAMNGLFAKLDTLTHFHFTPKNLNAEVKIVKNMPSVAVEDVAPVTASDATLLAPQEIADAQRGAPLGSTERTETDKARDRRRKKSKQRKIGKLEEKKLNANGGAGLTKEKALQRLSKDDKVTTVKENKSKGVKSSTQFFSQLQNEAAMSVKEKAKLLKKKAKKGASSEVKARSMKL